jgi:hypothetical protein
MDIFNSMEQSPSWKVENCSASQAIPHFYGIQRFITMFKEPDIGPYPDPDEYSPYFHILFL